jgi:hypothetical protein
LVVAARKIGALLGAPELSTLSRKARRLATLQQLFLDCAPPALTRASRVAQYQTGTLFLAADNAAVAAKLRQLAPSLLSNIRKREPEITGIKIAVQVKEITSQAQRARPPGHAGIENLHAFRALADALPESGLKSAVRALVRRHERTKRSGDQ